MSRITRRSPAAIKAAEAIEARGFAGIRLQQTYLEGIRAVSLLEIESSATPILVAKAQALIAIGACRAELELPAPIAPLVI